MLIETGDYARAPLLDTGVVESPCSTENALCTYSLAKLYRCSAVIREREAMAILRVVYIFGLGARLLQVGGRAE